MLLVGMLFVLSVAVYAQTDDAACAALVEQTVSSTTASCVSSGGDTVCSAQSSVSVGGTNTDLSTPISISSVNSIQSNAISVSAGSWGVAVMNFQAQPDKQTVWMALLGDSNIEKQGDNFQDIHIRTGFGTEECANVPNLVAIYATGEDPVDLTIKDMQVQLQGIATFQFQNQNNLIVTLLLGSMEILDANPIQEGESLVAVTDNEGVVLFWSSARSMTDIEAEQGQIALSIFNGLTDESLTVETACIEQPPHIVSSGENLYRIAQRYGTTVDELVILNNIADATRIYAGQEIQLPCQEDSDVIISSGCGSNTVHIVTRGETLFSIAQRYGTTVNAIAAANNLVNPQTIHAGNILQIPCDDGTAPPAATNNNNQQPDNPNPPPADPSGTLQQLCAGLLASISQTNPSQQLLDYYEQTCGG